MFGFLYIFLNLLTGYVLCSLCIPRLMSFTRKTYFGEKISLSPALLCIPLWYVTGAFLMTWATYFMAYLAYRCGSDQPLLTADMIVMPTFAILDLMGIYYLKVTKQLRRHAVLFRKPGSSEAVFAVIAFLFAAFLMWWTFSYQNGTYRVGLSVFSDFAPHLGMIQSFAKSKGTNIPTSYSHFAGEDIKYHFLFQFMVGNLELLGMRLDWAFNLPSVICLAGAFCLLYVLAMKLTGKKAVAWISGLLFAFRSSDAVFDYLSKPTEKNIRSLFPELFDKMTWNQLLGDPDKLSEVTWDSLQANEGFVGTTLHEDWGLWNLNVYCNQRHLAIGLCALLLLIIFLLPTLFSAVKRIRGCIFEREAKIAFDDENPGFQLLYPERVGYAMAFSLGTKEGWLPRSWVQPIFFGCLLGMCSFFNGACVIGCLCVLFVLAIASDHRLEYAITAAITIAFTLFATHFFIDGSAVEPKYYFGFLAEIRTAAGAWEYIMTLCGILPLVLLAAFLLADGTRKWIWFAFTAPFILAFTTSLTIDITVNHKYIMMSLMLLAIPAAHFLVWLWERAGAWPKIVSVLLIFVLTATGLYDLRTVIRKNDIKQGRYLGFAEDDPITQWVWENATSKDIFLSPYYSLNNFVMGGAMLYYGWPYYAWSAGYATDIRQQNVKKMYEAESPVQLAELVTKYNIRYIVVDDDARSSKEYRLNENVIRSTYEVVMSYGNTDIYDTQKLSSVIYVPMPEENEEDEEERFPDETGDPEYDEEVEGTYDEEDEETYDGEYEETYDEKVEETHNEETDPFFE
ncbi:MAG: hypothetical protein J6Y10_10980 [Lachnospiraceae bacterium]|nr:hypothetical protein [Lachnospiraceae bacterium]